MAGDAELRHVQRLWADYRPLTAIVAEARGLGLSDAEVDRAIAQVAGPRNPARAAMPNDEGKQRHGDDA